LPNGQIDSVCAQVGSVVGADVVITDTGVTCT
jgi:hypothetical protein